MAIGLAAKELAKKLLKNKSLKKAINVTTKQTNKLKETVKVNIKKPAVKKAVGKTKEVSKKAVNKTKEISKKATIKAKEVGSKIADKTPEGVKKVAKGVATGATLLGAGIAGAGAGVGAATGGVIGGAAARLGGKGLRASKDAISKARGKPTKIGGTADRNMGKAQRLDKEIDNTFAGVAGGAAIGGITGAAGALLGAGALTASMLKSSTPKESLYDVKKQPDGNFMTSFNDPNKNKITSTSQLSSKEMGIVRGAIAGLDAILLSEDPRKERTMFNGYLSLLSKYGVSSVNGKNLSVNIAG